MFFILFVIVLLTDQVHAGNRTLTEDEVFNLVEAGYIADASACENPGQKHIFKLN